VGARLVSALLGALCAVGLATADAGVVRLRRAVDGVVVTVFTSPTPLRAGPVDVEVLVQDGASLAPLSGARVTLGLVSASREAAGVHAALATTGHGDNRLLHAARLSIPEAGSWQLEVEASGSGFRVQLATELDVAERSSPLRRYWAELAFPGVGVALFVLRQRLRRGLRGLEGAS